MPTARTPAVDAFRKGSLVNFLKDMSDEVHSQGGSNAVCLLPSDEGEMERLSWRTVAHLPSIDIFGTDPYWHIRGLELEPFVAEQSDRVLEVCEHAGKEGHIWVPAFKLPLGKEYELAVAMQIATHLGIRRIAAWGFRGSEAMSSVSCDRPDLVWEIIGKTYQKLHS